MQNSIILGKMVVKFGEDNLEVTKKKVNTRDNHTTIKYFVRLLK